MSLFQLLSINGMSFPFSVRGKLNCQNDLSCGQIGVVWTIE